jgi:hypothetical protein
MATFNPHEAISRMENPNSDRTPNESSRTRGVIVGALAGIILFLVVFSLSDLEMGVGRASLHPIHLVFAFAVVFLFAYLFSRRKRSESANEGTEKITETTASSNHMALLALSALISGPVLAFVVAFIGVIVFDVHPMDRGSIVFSITMIGVFVGVIVAIILAIAGSIK